VARYLYGAYGYKGFLSWRFYEFKPTYNYIVEDLMDSLSEEQNA
jgi:hypothetical protein